jgi:SAM-dependent methyltransferase
MTRPPPSVRRSALSPFVVSCVGALPYRPLGIAADLGCGYGRHTWLLASMGYTVLAFDLYHRALKAIHASKSGPSKRGDRERVYPVMANVDGDLPLKAGQLDLALAVHCSIHDNLRTIETALAPGGFLIYESFGGQGMNWLELPNAGQMRRKLRRQFELLVLEERRVGPEEKRAVVVRLFAQKR